MGFNLIPPQFRLLAAAGAVIFVIFMLWRVYSGIYSSGYDKCVVEYNKSAQAAKDAAQAEIIKIGDRYDKEIDAIQNREDGNNLAPGIIRDAIERVQ